MTIGSLLERPQLVTIQSLPTPGLSAAEALAEQTITHIIFDASISENYQSQARITRHPIEKGNGLSDITDHVEIIPRVITLEGLISDSPLPLQTLSLSAFTGGLSSSALGALLGSATLSQLGYDKLEELKNDRVPLSLVTGLTEISPILISSINTRRNAQVGKALSFTMTVEEVFIVDSDLAGDDLGFQSTQSTILSPLGIP